MNLFPIDTPPACDFQLMAYNKNFKAIIDFIRSHPQEEVSVIVLKAGYSMIGWHHGKTAVMAHILDQVRHSDDYPII